MKFIFNYFAKLFNLRFTILSVTEGQVIKMGKTAIKLLGITDEEFYEGMGVFFVTLAQDLGYGMLLSCLGRYFRDFFVNLDNLHDYLKFTFPR